MLRRDEAAVEVSAEAVRQVWRHFDLVGYREADHHRLERTNLALERHELVAKLAFAGGVADEPGEWVFPSELLDQEFVRRLTRLAFGAREDGHRRKRGFLTGFVDATDSKAHAGRQLVSVAPSDDDVVVRECNSVLLRF